MGKNIVRQTKGKPKNRNGLILNTSYDDFKLGNSIEEYKNNAYQIDKHDIPSPWECYNFIQNDSEIEVWCENNVIISICCNQSCIYKGHELIHMAYEDFLSLINETPSDHDICYVPINKDRGQNQHVYDFDKSGLQIWVWRNKIRTVIISTFEE